MARQFLILAVVVLIALAGSASADVNPAPKVSPDGSSASPLPAEKGDDNSMGDGDDGAEAPGMAVAASPDSKKSGAPAALGVSSTAGVISGIVSGILFSVY